MHWFVCPISTCDYLLGEWYLQAPVTNCPGKTWIRIFTAVFGKSVSMILHWFTIFFLKLSSHKQKFRFLLTIPVLTKQCLFCNFEYFQTPVQGVWGLVPRAYHLYVWASFTVLMLFLFLLAKLSSRRQPTLSRREKRALLENRDYVQKFVIKKKVIKMVFQFLKLFVLRGKKINKSQITLLEVLMVFTETSILTLYGSITCILC